MAKKDKAFLESKNPMTHFPALGNAETSVLFQNWTNGTGFKPMAVKANGSRPRDVNIFSWTLFREALDTGKGADIGPWAKHLEEQFDMWEQYVILARLETKDIKSLAAVPSYFIKPKFRAELSALTQSFNFQKLKNKVLQIEAMKTNLPPSQHSEFLAIEHGRSALSIPHITMEIYKASNVEVFFWEWEKYESLSNNKLQQLPQQIAKMPALLQRELLVDKTLRDLCIKLRPEVIAF